MKFIASLLPTMKPTTCVSRQAGREMRWEDEEEEEGEEKALGSSTKTKVKKKNLKKKSHIHTYKEKSLSCSYLSKLIPVSFYIW